MLIVKPVLRGYEQRVNSQQLPGVGDLIRVKQEGPGLHQTAIVHLLCSYHAGFLCQQATVIGQVTGNRQRQRVHTQHLALIDQ